VVSNWTGSEGEAFQAVIDAFQQKNPKVTVKVEQVPFDQTQALLTQQFAAGSPPDVAVALPGIIRTFAGQDLLLNLDQQWDTWIKDGAYTDALRQIASGPDGKAYAVYFKGNVNALVWYSPQQLKQLGIGVPTTWAEFTAAMDKAKAEGVAPLAVGGRTAGRSPSGPTRSSCASPAPRPSTTWPAARSAGTTRGSSSRSRCSAT
jgi:ABC-type glycerol-3-phosphate transport system substrate-binding protein